MKSNLSVCPQGLTMIVGPPGTGKTDVAVQVIANLYHSHPNEKILIVAHSNAALNDLFEKIMTVSADTQNTFLALTILLYIVNY